MRVALDANVVLRGVFVFGSREREILQAARRGLIHLVFSIPVMDELAVIMTRTLLERREACNPVDLQEFVRGLARMALGSELVQVPYGLAARYVEEDPEDDKLVRCAIYGNAEVVITRDTQLLLLDGQLRNRAGQTMGFEHPERFVTFTLRKAEKGRPTRGG